jgi:hypothetical protein
LFANIEGAEEARGASAAGASRLEPGRKPDATAAAAAANSEKDKDKTSLATFQVLALHHQICELKLNYFQ